MTTYFDPLSNLAFQGRSPRILELRSNEFRIEHVIEFCPKGKYGSKLDQKRETNLRHTI